MTCRQTPSTLGFFSRCTLPIGLWAWSTTAHAQTLIPTGTTETVAVGSNLGSVLQFGSDTAGNATLAITGAGAQIFGGAWIIDGANPIFALDPGVTFALQPTSAGLLGSPAFLRVTGGGTLDLGPGSMPSGWLGALDVRGGSTLGVGDRTWLTSSSAITLGADGSNTTLRYFDDRSAIFSGALNVGASGATSTINISPSGPRFAGNLSFTGSVTGVGDLRIRNDALLASPTLVTLGFNQGSYTGRLILDGGRVQLNNSRGIGSDGILVERFSNLSIGSSFATTAAQLLDLQSSLELRGVGGQEVLTWNGDIDLGGNTLSIESLQLTLDAAASFTAAGGTIDLTSSGILALNGEDLDDATILSTGGILTGPGMVGTIGNGSGFGGTIQMGDGTTAGTLTVNGNANLQGAFIESLLFAGGSADLLEVGGLLDGLNQASIDLIYDATVAGGSLIPANGTSVTYDVLTATLISGTPGTLGLTIIDPLNDQFSIQFLDPSTVNTDAAGVQFEWIQDADSASLVITGAPNPSITGPGTTQTNIGTVNNTNLVTSVNQLNTLVNAPTQTADGRFVGTSLLLLTPAVLPGAVVTAAVPANPNALPNTTFNAMTQAGQVAKLRLMQLRDGGPGAAAVQSASGSLDRDAYGDADYRTLSQGGVAEQGSVVSDPLAIDAAINGASPSSGSRGWARGFGFYESVSGQSYAQGDYNASMGGLMAGADMVLDGNILAGAFAGITPGDLTIDSTMGSTQNDLVGVNFGAYASWAPASGEAYLQGYAMANYYDADQTRTIAIPGIDRTATSSANVWGAMVGAEGGLNMPLGPTTVLQPYAGLDYGYYTRDGYTESGAGSLNLTVSSQDANLLQPTAGARVMQTFQVGRDRVTPYFGAAFIAQLPLGTWSETASSSFSGADVFSFTEGTDEQYGASYQAGLEFAAAERWTAYISFNGMSMTDTNVFGGQIGINFEF
jgi:uncharacterized protein YhjY with autotransporter beta-barrel domain